MPAAYLLADVAILPTTVPGVLRPRRGRAAGHGPAGDRLRPRRRRPRPWSTATTGWLVAPGDADAWADGHGHGHRPGPGRRAEMGEAGLNRARQLYSRRRHVRGHAGGLRAGAGGPRARDGALMAARDPEDPGDQAVGAGRLRPGAGGDEEDPRGPPEGAHHPADHPAVRGAGQGLPLFQRGRHRRAAGGLRPSGWRCASGCAAARYDRVYDLQTSAQLQPHLPGAAARSRRPGRAIAFGCSLPHRNPLRNQHAHPGAPGRPADVRRHLARRADRAGHARRRPDLSWILAKPRRRRGPSPAASSRGPM